MIALWGILIILIILLIYVNIITPPEYPIEVKQSQIHGRGVFAKRAIPSNSVIEVAPLIIFNKSDVKVGTILRDYDIQHRDGKHAIMLGYASLYNHSDIPNASWEFNYSDEIEIRSTKDIAAGDEILVNYGSNYWTGNKVNKKNV